MYRMASLLRRRSRSVSPTQRVCLVANPDAELFKKEFETAQKTNEAAGKSSKDDVKETKEETKEEPKTEAKEDAKAEEKA